MWERGSRIMTPRLLRAIAVLAVVSLLSLTLRYIYVNRQIVTTQHQEIGDLLKRNVTLCNNMTTYNTGTFTSTLQSILDWTICAHTSVTPWPNSSDIYISVRTTSSNHKIRLPLLLTTWMQKVHPKQVSIITDTSDDMWTQMANSMGMNTSISDCEASHAKPALWCKSGFEYEQYYANRGNYRWFCHFDDDTYVNIPVLVKTLQQYNPEKERLYFGRMPPIFYSRPERWKNIMVSNHTLQTYFPGHKGNANARYYYATGAAYCFSSSLMAEMEIYIRGENFSTTCSRVDLSDDIVLGTITSVILGYNLTEMPLMKSHIEAMEDLPSDHLKDYISLGYSYRNKKKRVFGIFTGTGHYIRRVNIPRAQFSTKEDPSSFLSYHCLLFPETSWCKNINVPEVTHEHFLQGIKMG